MLRIHMTLSKRKDIDYRNMDILHDTIVNVWTCAGADPEKVMPAPGILQRSYGGENRKTGCIRWSQSFGIYGKNEMIPRTKESRLWPICSLR